MVCDGLGYAIHSTIDELWWAYRQAEIILIDMPIGLPDAAPRPVDAAAWAVLGVRRSSVFAVPVRRAVYAESYQQGCEINQQATGKKFSKQLWNITPKIREVDKLLQADDHARQVIKESHPEVVFTMLNGQPMQHNKKTAEGFAERLMVLHRFKPEAENIIQRGMTAYKRGDVARDDLVDALVLAVAAESGNFKTLPPVPSHDSTGLPMQIVYSERPAR